MVDKFNRDSVVQDDTTLSHETDPSVAFERELTMVYLMLKDEVREIHEKRPKNHPADNDRSSTILRTPSTPPPVIRAARTISLKAQPRKAQSQSNILEYPMGDHIILQTADASTEYDQNISLPVQNHKRKYYLKPVNLQLKALEKTEITPPNIIEQRALESFPTFEYDKPEQETINIEKTKTPHRYRKYHVNIPYSSYSLRKQRHIRPLENAEVIATQADVYLKERTLKFPGEFTGTTVQTYAIIKEQKKSKTIDKVIFPDSDYKGKINLPITPKVLTSPKFLNDISGIELKQSELRIVNGTHTVSNNSEKTEIKSKKIRTKPEKGVNIPAVETRTILNSLKPVKKNEEVALKVACLPLAPIPNMISSKNIPEVYYIKVKDAKIRIEKNVKKRDNSIQQIRLIPQSSDTKIKERKISTVFFDDSVIKSGEGVAIGKTRSVRKKMKQMVIPNGKRHLIAVRKLRDLTTTHFENWHQSAQTEVIINPAKEAYDDIMKEMVKYKEHIDSIIEQAMMKRKKLAFLDSFTPLTSRKLTQQWEDMGGPEALIKDFLNT